MSMAPARTLWVKIRGLIYDLTAPAEGTFDQCKCIHWPGGQSGVTLGRGFDMRGRKSDDILSHLTNAGINAPWLARASMQGEVARQFVEANRHRIELTHDQLYYLFDDCVLETLATVIRVCEKAVTVKTYGPVDFVALDPALLALVVDLCYRGDYHPETRRLGIQRALVDNSLGLMAECLAHKYWACVPRDRHRRRLEFCERHMEGAS